MAKPLRTAGESFRALLKSVGYDERLRVVRAYYPGFGPRQGYDIRRLDKLTGQQKAKLTRYYSAIRPFLGAPLVKQKLASPELASAAWRGLFGLGPPLGTLYVPILESPVNKPQLIFRREAPPPTDVREMIQRVRARFPGDFTAKDGFDIRRVKRWEAERFEALEDAYQQSGDLMLQSVRLRGGIHTNKHYFEDYGLTEQQLALTGEETDNRIRAMLQEAGGTHFAVVTGDYLFGVGGKRGERDEVFMGNAEEVIRTIRRLQNTYSQPDASNYWGNWLHGIKSFRFGNTDRAITYRRRVKQERKQYTTRKKRLVGLNRAIFRAQARLDELQPRIKEIEDELRLYRQAGARGSRYVRFMTGRLQTLKRQRVRTIELIAESIRKRTTLICEITARKVSG